MKFTSEHQQFRAVVRSIVENEINPHVDEWENAGIFPAIDPVRSRTHRAELLVDREAHAARLRGIRDVEGLLAVLAGRPAVPTSASVP